MTIKIKNRHRPLYKKFISIKENIQNRKKLLQFKKNKWQKLIQAYKRRLRFYKKFAPKDLTQYVVCRYPTRWFSYKNRYKSLQQELKKIKLLYGGLPKNYLKKITRKALTKKYASINFNYLEFFESRLDVVLYRSKFSKSIKGARQMILHRKVLVNNSYVTNKSYLLKPGDLISINPNYFKLFVENIRNSAVWPIPPKHLTISYTTLQISFGIFKFTNLSLHFFYSLNLEKVITNYQRH